MYIYKFKLTRVIDGDTVDGFIDLGFGISIKHRIRLLGIDAPELRSKLERERALAISSKDHLKLVLYNADTITVKTSKDASSRFGRILGELYVDIPSETPITNHVSVNRMLVEEKLAVPYDGGTKQSFESCVSSGSLLDPDKIEVKFKKNTK